MPRINLAILFTLALLCACRNNFKSEKISNSSEINFYIGEQGDALAKRHPNSVSVNHQPAGLDFYKLKWKPSAGGTVNIENEKYSFKIENVVSLTGTQDIAYKEEGISEATVYSGITATDLISHDEARLKTAEILRKIMQAGWKVQISEEAPRLRGKDTVDYLLKSKKTFTLDAGYTPTFDEWMQLESQTTWAFYANHIFLEVSFTRERTLTDPAKPGAYVLGFDLKNEAEYFRGFVAGDDRPNWRTLVPSELTKMKTIRAAIEAKIRLAGIKIDETYEDAPFPDVRKK